MAGFSAVYFQVIKSQQEALQELKEDLNQSQPNYANVVSTGHELIDLCGEPDKPEVKKSIEELDHVWGNITQLFLQRDTDLVDAMDKSMSFHGLLQSLTQFLDEAEDAFGNMGNIGAEIDTVKEQMEQLKVIFKEVINKKTPLTLFKITMWWNVQELLFGFSKNFFLFLFLWDFRFFLMFFFWNPWKISLWHWGIWLRTTFLFDWIYFSFSLFDTFHLVFQEFRSEMEPHTVDVQSLLTQAEELIIRTSEEQAEIVSVPVLEIEQRWETLRDGVNERHDELENALVRLGQFREALADLVSWITEKDAVLGAWAIPFGDSKTIELEMAKHKVCTWLFLDFSSVNGCVVWLTGKFIVGFIHRSIDWLNNSSIDWLYDWLIDWLMCLFV